LLRNLRDEGKMIKILIVDDDEDILVTIKYGLENINNEYKIKTAKNGSECLSLLNEEIPDLILLDLMMPNMNGWQILEIILGKPKWRDIPVFIITGASNHEFKKQAENLGITYIEKPFDMDMVDGLITNLLNK
jgi:putative two-component system response regulator